MLDSRRPHPGQEAGNRSGREPGPSFFRWRNRRPDAETPRPAGALRSPLQVSLGMLVLGAGVACLVFATVGNQARPPQSPPATTVTIAGLAAGSPTAQVTPTPPPAPATRSTPRASRSPVGKPGRRPTATRSGPAKTGSPTSGPTASGSTPKAGTTSANSAAAVDPSVDLAASRPVRASSHAQDYVASNITDGDVNTYWEAESGFPQSVTVDLGRVRKIGRIVLSLPSAPDWNRRTQTIALDGSRNGDGYTQVASAALYTFDANASGDEVTVAVPGTRTRYLRLTFTANDGWPAAQLSGLQVHSG